MKTTKETNKLTAKEQAHDLREAKQNREHHVEVAQRKRRDRGDGSIHRHPNSRFWHYTISVNSIPQSGSTRTESKTKARQFVRALLAEADTGDDSLIRNRNVRVEEIAQDFLTHLKANGSKSYECVARRWRLHLLPYFRNWKASAVKSPTVDRYKLHRQGQGAANATVNRELAFLHAAFKRAKKDGKVRTVPEMEGLREDNARTGFVGEAEYLRMIEHANPLWFRVCLEIGRSYGWRLQEVLGLRVWNVDLPARTLSLDQYTTKNGEGRVVHLTDTLVSLLSELIAGKKKSAFVLTRQDGSRVLSFNSRWQRCCVLAKVGAKVHRKCFYNAVEEKGEREASCIREEFTLDSKLCCRKCGDRVRHADVAYSGLLFHDLRRSAARDLLRSGTQEKVVMTILGHKTRSMLDRYNIIDDRDVRAAMERYQKQQLADREALRAEKSENLVTSSAVGLSEGVSESSPAKIERLN